MNFKALGIIIILATSSFTMMHAEDKVKIKTYPNNKTINKVFNKTHQEATEKNIEVLNIMLKNIDKEEYITPYKRYLLKNLAMLNYQAFLFNGQKNKLLQTAKYIFPLSMCAAYQFKDDLIRQLDKSFEIFIKTDHDKAILGNSFKEMDSIYLNKTYKEFNPKQEFFIENCTK
jgi:hypothetical protein